MSELPAPPATRLRPPSWLDGRLVAGVVLVLLSVVVGARIIASSDRYDAIWAASHAIAPGTTLTKSDLLRVNVRFKDHGGLYISANGPSPAGRTTIQPLAAGQLIASAALPPMAPAQVRLVTVPVAKLHMPRGNDLHGVQVDLYVTPKSGFGAAQPTPQLVLANVTINDTITDSSLGGSGGSGVVLAVPLSYVDAVVAAAQLGAVDLVRVPSDVTASGPSQPAPSSQLGQPSPSSAQSP
ncbi:MAG: hypothetical protein QOG69_1956 [Actinomycetota bacterium]|nr:hypothetical protein [Actinomycetota bacterium]